MQLLELIQSMSKAEKKHFKLYVQSSIGKGKYPKYLVLFDFLNKQEYYDEKKIIKKGFTYNDKNFLNEKILEALCIYNSNRSIDSKLSVLLNQISILYERSLWGEIGKRIKKAKKIANKHERFLCLLQIIKWEKTIADTMGEYDKYLLLIEEETGVRKKMNSEINYANSIDKIMFTLIRDRNLAQLENRQLIRQLAHTALVKKHSTASSVLAQINYHRIKFRYYMHLEDNKEKAYVHAIQIIELFKKYSFILSADKPKMIGVYLITLYWQKELNNDSNQTLDFIKIIDNLPFKSLHNIYATYLFGLAGYQRNLNKIQGESLIEKIEKEGYIAEIKLNKQLPLFYNIMTFYGTFNEWKKAQVWLNKILSIKRPTIRKDIQINARYWLLIISYETNSTELGKHIQSLQTYLKRGNYYFSLDKHILQAFNDLQQVTRHKEEKKIWEKLHDLLDEESKSQLTRIPQIDGLKL